MKPELAVYEERTVSVVLPKMSISGVVIADVNGLVHTIKKRRDRACPTWRIVPEKKPQVIVPLSS
jgi:hypothetical protein